MLRFALARVGGHAGDPPAWLGESERRRWHVLAPAARAPFAAARALLRELLQDATGVAAARWCVSAEAGTAPVATLGASAGAPRVSLSHRLGWVAAAVADAAVGIDLECDRPSSSDPAERAALMLAPIELADWSALPAHEREAGLLARWSAKEAWFKASPAQAEARDFRRLRALACEPERANVRTWRAAPLHVAVSFGDAAALAAATGHGLPGPATSTSWHVASLSS